MNNKIVRPSGVHLAASEMHAVPMETTSAITFSHSPRTFIYPSGATLIVEEDPGAKRTSIAVFCSAGIFDLVPGNWTVGILVFW